MPCASLASLGRYALWAVRAGRSVRTLGAPAYFLCGALNKTSSSNAGRNAKRIPRAPSPVRIETMFLIEFKPFLGV